MNRKDLKKLGFLKHDGGECPVAPEQYVELLIRTSEGLGSSLVIRADRCEWRDDRHVDGLGRVRFYRLESRGGQALINPYHRFEEPKE